MLQPHEGSRPIVMLIVPTEIGQSVHSHSKKPSEQQRGHGAFINSISQLCLRHASKTRISVESKWKVNSKALMPQDQLCALVCM